MRCLLVLIVSLVIFSCNNKKEPVDYLGLKNKLAGKWQAKAFNGVLEEEWLLSKNGWMQQQSYYIEEKDTSYSAKTRIEKVGDDVVLFSVIKNANPKIFKSVNFDDYHIVFENMDYKNPFQVKYEFFNTSNYRRTIKGYEGDSLVVYEFNFTKKH